MNQSVVSNKLVHFLKPILQRFQKGTIYIVPLSKASEATCKNVELEKITIPRRSRTCFNSLQCAFSAFSSVISILGVLITLLAIWLKADTIFWTLLNPPNLQQFCATDYIGIGAAVLIIGLTGSYIANDKNAFIMKMYFCLMFILIVLEITAVGVLWFVVRNDQFDVKLAERMKDGITFPDKNFHHFMDVLQIRYECCGAISRRDYQVTPISCWDPITDSYHDVGCAIIGSQYVKSKATLLGTAFITTLIVQVGALFCTIFLIGKLQRIKRQRFYYSANETEEAKRPILQ